MNLREWYALRGPAYARTRAAALLGGSGLTPSKAADRVLEGIEWLTEPGCVPKLPVSVELAQ